jgi:hypothetical protein
MNNAKEIGAYLGLVLLTACVLAVGIVSADVAGGLSGIPVGVVAAAATFQVLRRVTGRAIAAAVDSM